MWARSVFSTRRWWIAVRTACAGRWPRLQYPYAGGAVVILLGLTALISYSMGRRDAPSAAPSRAAVALPSYSKPIALVDAPLRVPAVQPQPAPTSSPTPNAKASQPPTNAPQPETKRKVEVALTAEAIAAIIIKASRDRYYATGTSVRLPGRFDAQRSSLRGRSAYSRPGELRRCAIQPT